MDQLTDIHSAIINELNVLTTEYGSTIDLAISSVDLIRNSHWSQVDDLVSDHIASPIVIQNYFIPVSQSSILKWNTRRADWKKYSITFHVLTPYISSNPYIDIHLANILDAIQWAAELSVHKHTGNHYNRRINFLPQQTQWKKVNVIPRPKSGGSSYRSTSLHQNISKIMEKMIAKRLSFSSDSFKIASRGILECFQQSLGPSRQRQSKKNSTFHFTHPLLVRSKPPWLLPPFEVRISRDHPKKYNPISALTCANSRIRTFSNPHTRVLVH
ncbi:hypothetical protein LSH36_45g01035 [Paralvinella palmiformis]|uniref:Uncharacterized protein n=1 Tax=Paralvinella palmiformis TaxID=53620 RepID=A0AAD9K838_9ANNE|nr:hypothetical protein LSH36_45g01035 [Paralvinella palmiformis]